LANTLALEDLQLGLRNGTRETELIQSKWPTKANHKRDVYDGVIMMSVYLTYTVNI